MGPGHGHEARGSMPWRREPRAQGRRRCGCRLDAVDCLLWACGLGHEQIGRSIVRERRALCSNRRRALCWGLGARG